MKTLILLITIIAATSLVSAGENEEIIWETEQIGGINDVLVSPLGEIFYNVTGSTIQIRSIEDGTLIDYFIPDDMPNHITDISITDDGRLMAMSGDNPHIVIYDLVEKREIKRLTALVFEQEEFGKNVEYEAEKWVCSSISPDGTKVTGVAISDRGRNKSNFIVFDVESENVIYESRRLSYDMNNPSSSNYWWRSAEFTPDGKYIVSQLDYGTENSYGPDSIYIHNANTFEIYDVVLNRYSESNLFFNLSNSQSEFTYYDTNVDKISIFNISTKKSIETNIKPSIWSFTFLRISDFIIYAYDSEFQLYDYVNDKILHKYVTIGKGWATTLDDRILISSYYNKILGINTFIIKTSIDNDYEEEIVISPNPTTGNINIQLNNQLSSEFQYELINVSGQIIKSSTLGFVSQNGQSSIDISDVPNGHYTIRVYSNREDFTFSIIKEG